MYKNCINSIFYKLRTSLFMGGFFFSFFSAYALEIPHDIVLLETVSSIPLRFDYIKTSEKNTLAGNLINVPSSSNIGKIVFSIIDSNQAILWEKKEDKPENIQQNKPKVIPFFLTLPTEKFPKNSELKITLFGLKQNFLGSTQKKLPFSSFIDVVSVSNLNVSIPDNSSLGEISFLVSNNEKNLNFSPQIRISPKDVEERIFFKKIFPEEQIKNNSTKVFSFSFNPPTSPGLYSVELLLLDKEENTISGRLKKDFLIEGAFARITSFDTSANRFLLESDTLSIAFQGFVPDSQKETFAEVSIKQHLEEKVVDFLFQSVPLTVKNSKISGLISFPLENPASQFIIELKIKQGNDILISKIFKSKNFPAPLLQEFSKEQEEDLSQKIEKLEQSFFDDWILWIAIIFLFFLIALNSWLRQEKRFFLLLLTPLFLCESAFAAVTVFWHHPIANWSFNPIAIENKFLPFKKVLFHGNIFDNLTQHGFFQETPQRIIVKFFKDGNDVYVEPESFTIQNTKTYDFEINLPTSLSNGAWGAQILFKMNSSCGESGWCGTAWQDTLLIDKTPPSLNIVYDNDASKALFRTTLGASEETLHQYLILKEFNINLRRSKLFLKNDKVIERMDIFQIKMHKEKTLGDKNEYLYILQQKLADNIAIIERRTEEDDILKAALEAQIIIVNEERLALANDITSIASDITTLSNEITSLEEEITTLNENISTPETIIESIKQSIRTIKRGAKKDSVAVNISCSDGGASCHRNSVDLIIRGNFCEESEPENNCDSIAPRNIKVCDNIGNCTFPEENSLEIDWYDPAKPTISQSILWKNKGNVGGTEFFLDDSATNTNISTGENIAFEITAADFENPTKATHPAFFDDDACGSNADSFLFPKGGRCVEDETVCAISSSQRGIIDDSVGGTCTTECAPGYIADGLFCILKCDYHLFDGCLPFNLIGVGCEDSEWLPTPESVQNGTSFVQTSNCGSTRQAVGTGTGLYQVEASLQFGALDNSFLSRFPLIGSNQNTWTWSGWIKQGELDRSQIIFNAGDDNTNWTSIKFDDSNRLQIEHQVDGTTNTNITSSTLFNNQDTWMHLVVVWDTTNVLPENRVQIYVDDNRIVNFDTNIIPPLHSNSFINNLSNHSMGRFVGTSSEDFFNGLFAEVVFVDGQSLSPSSFGEYNIDTKWIPRSFDGTHGTNGFHLNFSDSSFLMSLGNDSSENNNHWLLNNFELSDSLSDSPSNP